MKKISLSIVALLMCFSISFSQEKKKSEADKKWEIGLNAGVAKFTGEYNMFKDSRFKHFNDWSNEMNFGFGAFIKKNFSHVFAMEVAWQYSVLTGTWKSGPPVAHEFKTEVNEYDLNTVWNLNNLFSRNKFNRTVYWYAKLGIGATYLWEKEGATPLNGENWQLPTIPVGTGIIVNVSDNMKFNIGTQWSWINTDRLDGHAEATTAQNTKAGNTVPDIFGTELYTHVGISYAFGKKKKPEPVIQTPIPTPVPEPKPAPKPEPIPQPKPAPKPEPVPEPAPVVVPPVKPAVPSVVGNTYKLYFAFNFVYEKLDPKNQSTIDLNHLVIDMINNPTVGVELKSHTDSRGTAAYNMVLSEKRGKSVYDFLISKGISPSRIKSQAFGETQPVNKCKDGVQCTAAEHAANRRTEATLVLLK